MGYYKGDKAKKDFVRRNEMIRVPQVLLIENGVNLGATPTSVALAKARALGLDLVEVAPQARPPVCSILDYGKFMFDKQKKEKDKEKSHASEEKEIQFKYVTDDHDLQIKANQLKSFIDKGHRVRVVVKFEKREKAHPEKGFEAINKFLKMIEEFVTVEKSPVFEGKNIMARVQKKT
jgi:translation initiation factor IF-3